MTRKVNIVDSSTGPTPPRFSFLTTAYRTERYIPETIESVLAQTSDDWELVVVDNGMSDEMAHVVQPYLADPRIELVRQPNRGYTGGIAAAVARAHGSFLCVLDSDDHLMPEFCARVGAVLDAAPGVAAVACDAHLFTDAGSLPGGYMRSIGMPARPAGHDRLTVRDVLGGEVPYYGAAIRREAWDAVDAYASGLDDVDESVIVWLRLTSRFDVRTIPDRLARYRLRGDSDSRDASTVENFERQLLRSFESGQEWAQTPENVAALDATVRRLRYHQSLRRARWAFRDGDLPGARAAARAAFSHRRTLRAAVALSAVTVAPGVVRWLYPAKQRVSEVASRVVDGVATRAQSR